MKSCDAADPFMPTHADKIGERRGEGVLTGAAGGAEESVSENDRATLFVPSSPDELAAFFVGRCVFIVGCLGSVNGVCLQLQRRSASLRGCRMRCPFCGPHRTTSDAPQATNGSRCRSAIFRMSG